MLDDLKELASRGLAELRTVASGDALESWRIKYLGAKGALKGLMGRLKDVPRDEKPAVGARLNEIKSALEEAFEQTRTALKQRAGGDAAAEPFIDVTVPGFALGQGRRHILSRTIDEITEVFARMGFSAVTGPEVEDEWHNFAALNIPEHHPAREATDNFYLAALRSGDVANGGRQSPNPLLMLRSQTSTVQIRTMEKTQPPLKVIAVGRVYRPDTHDATHFSMFHQVEGLYVDRNVSMVDLKTTLFQFARAYFGPQAEVRMRPSFFPFTEPSAEMDISCSICKGAGCNMCKHSGWVEILGCGMVDPNVFSAVGIDPERYTGWAFGFGIERLIMRKHNIVNAQNEPDIRVLVENDLRFLRQF